MQSASDQKVRIGNHVIDLAAISDMHWEREKLFLHFVGGRFLQLVGSEAKLVWAAYMSGAVDLATGELVGG